MAEDRKDMDIKIIHVEISEVPKKTGKGTNKSMSVTFENLTFNGKTDGKKMQDWATPKEVWDTLAAAKHGDIFHVVYQKNEKGFNDWLELTPEDAVAVVQHAAQPRAKTPAQTREAKSEKVAGTWDVKNQLDRERFEYDKSKQALIIRQSSLSTAVALLTAGGKAAKVEDVISVATAFENWVTQPELEIPSGPDEDETFPE
jgi:hypothetical protein